MKMAMNLGATGDTTTPDQEISPYQGTPFSFS